MRRRIPGRTGGRRPATARWRVAVIAPGLSALVVATAGCGAVEAAVPSCVSIQQLAIVAQSVPSASYVPCIGTLPPGWRATGFRAANGSTHFSLVSDRATTSPVAVALVPACSVKGATLTGSRAPGAGTYTRLLSISPVYAGTVSDVFAGGCVTYRFAFQRGPHIPLMEEFEGAVGLFPRQELSLELDKRLGITLTP